MKQIAIVGSSTTNKAEEKINIKLKEIQDLGGEIIDIKYQEIIIPYKEIGYWTGAMIIYETKPLINAWGDGAGGNSL